MAGREVRATLSFARAGEGDELLFSAADRSKSHMPLDDHDVAIGDVRPIASELSFDRNGFVLTPFSSALKPPYTPENIETTYFPEIEATVRRLTGAEKVVCFGAVARTDDPAAKDSGKPAQYAHVDFDAPTIQSFARDLLGEQAAAFWLRRRHLQLNVWRPLSLVERKPLALADASTVSASDLAELKTIGALNDPNRAAIYGFVLRHSPRQRWWYAPAMRPDEAWVFKMFDSDSSRVQLTAHSAFDDPTASPQAPPRESIEVRTIAFMPA